MRIAYLILAYNNIPHLKLLVQSLKSPDTDCYIHFDKKYFTLGTLPLAHAKIISKVSVYWGEFSQLYAIIELIKFAISNGSYDYFVLLSGSDYPIRSNSYILRFFQKYNGSQFINICTMPKNNKSFNRIEKYSINSEVLPYSTFRKIANTFLRILPYKRKLPTKYSNYTLFAGSTWWGLSSSCIQYILTFIQKNPGYLNFYKKTHCPDEMFFHTIIGNSQFNKYIKPAIFYADWDEGGAHPSLISQRHLAILRKEKISTSYGDSTPLFARKFSSDKKIISEVERMRNEY